jgi:hypothetical protein
MRYISIGRSVWPAFLGTTPLFPLFPLFLQEINSGRGSFAAGIHDSRGNGKRTNSGTTAHVTQPIYLLRIFDKIAP